MTGRALGDCLQQHGGAMGRGAGARKDLPASNSSTTSGMTHNDSTRSSGTPSAARGNGGGAAPTGSMGGTGASK
jgi:hypothetical protein